MFGWEFPPYISGGLGVACHDLTKALCEKDVEVSFVVPTLKSDPDPNLHLNLIGSSNVAIKRHEQLVTEEKQFIKTLTKIEVKSPLKPYINEKSYEELLAKISEVTHKKIELRSDYYNLHFSGAYGPDLFSEVVRYAFIAGLIAREEEHDLIHCHDWLTIMAGIEARKQSGKKLIYHVHALETDRSGSEARNQIYDIERYGLHEADQIIAVSHLTKNSLINYYDIPESKIEVVHNAVSKNKSSTVKKQIKKKDNEKIILFLGRLTFQKGPDYFLEAAAKVLKLEKNARFVVAGSGDMTHKLIERAADLGISRKFHFTGFLKRDEVEAVLASSDVYVMSSVSEPFGISCLEAMLYDIPVIISKQSGAAEVLGSALKVDFWDTDELANQILSAIRYPALREEMKEKSRIDLANIQWEKSADRVIEVYSSLS